MRPDATMDATYRGYRGGMAIEPDTKDWTWVVERRCGECGEDASRIEPERVGSLVRDCAVQWRRVLTTAPAVRERPSPDVWSALEYGCHVRDVFRVFDRRVALMLEHDDPQFDSWDQDEAAVTGRYGEQDPETVADELDAAAAAIADRFDTVTGEQWERPGRRGDGSSFTVTTIARYLLHDVVHHLHDVRFARPR
jgi:DinB superfamily